MRDKVILTDVDGVLLDWEFHFYRWMWNKYGIPQVANEYNVGLGMGMTSEEGKEYVREFNDSDEMYTLSPLGDAIKYVRKLHEEYGFIFHVITSQSSNPEAQEKRVANLMNVFGESMWDGFTILGCGDDKGEALSQWKGSSCWWLEDKPDNIIAGNKYGLDGLLMSNSYNINTLFGGKRVSNWRDIYNTITGNY